MSAAFTSTFVIHKARSALGARSTTRPSSSPNFRRSVPTAVISKKKVETVTQHQPLAPFSWTEQWYPVIPEYDAPVDEPYAFKLFDIPLVLYRVAPGEWAVLDDRCSHRLAPLSEGRVVHNDEGKAELECAYHGWSFGGCGTCTRIPQLGEGVKIPRRSTVTSYRTVVDVGLIWIYLGDPENASDLPPMPPVVRGIRGEASTFMRIVPYGYEALAENLLDPEHVYWAHHGSTRGFERQYGGIDVLEAESIPGTHNMRTFRTGRGLNIPGGFTPPCTVFVDVSSPRAKASLVVLAVPSSRFQSRIFIVTVFELLNTSPRGVWSLSSLRSRVLRAILRRAPRWYRHLPNNTVLDGDNVFLRGVQEALPDPATWRKEYIPMANCDASIVWFRSFMDTTRSSMPWRSPDGPLPPLTKYAMIERDESHTQHCKSCYGAKIGFERAVKVASFVAALCAITVIYAAVAIVLGSALNQPIFFAAVAAIGVVAVFLRRYFLSMLSLFVYTDIARRKLLAD